MRHREEQPESTRSPGDDATHHSSDRRDHRCCDMTIHIHNQGGTVNIYNCPPVVGGPKPPPPAQQPPGMPPTGACVPLALGSKPKRSLEAKLRPLLANNHVPSVLAASVLHTARRYSRGHSPANALEAAAFRVFERLSPDLQDVLACSVQVFDALPPKDRDRVFSAEITGLGDQPVEPSRLAELVSAELSARSGLQVFGETDCMARERPGRARYVRPSDDVGINFVGICRVNGLRTNAYTPPLRLGDYTPDEVQQECTLEVVDDRARLNCRVQTADCPGHELEGTCLRVPDVVPGEAVVLEGYNYFNTAARVRLEAQPPGTVTREVDARVCGDVTTPLTEVVDGVNRVIADCRVRDRITFQVPKDLPEGTYGMRIVFANNSGNPGFGEVLESSPPQFIRVVPGVTATFQIATERLKADEETSPSYLGSDEVAVRVLAIPVAPDLSVGEVIEHNWRFGDVDSGETRDMSRVIFEQSEVGGVSLSIIGFEVDDEDAFEKQITDLSDAYVEVLSSQWNTIAGAVGTAGGLIAGAIGLSYAWSLAIAAAITLAIDLLVALWAPADLIIEDAAAFTALDLAMRLSPNFPPPPVLELTSAGGIDVKVEPVSKDVQYIERRKYVSDEEESEYHITLRYSRL